MLEAIKEGILSIVDFFTSIGDFITSIVENTIMFVDSYSTVMSKLPEWIDYLPAFLIVAVLPLFTVQIVLRLIGR